MDRPENKGSNPLQVPNPGKLLPRTSSRRGKARGLGLPVYALEISYPKRIPKIVLEFFGIIPILGNMNEALHPDRNAALLNYSAKLTTRKQAERGTDELAFFQAKADAQTALERLVEMEIKYPTKEELKKKALRIARENRGLLD